MHQHHLRRLLKRILILCAPLPAALVGVACGGSASIDAAVGGQNNGSSPSGGTAAAPLGGSGAIGGALGSSGSTGVGGTRLATGGAPPAAGGAPPGIGGLTDSAGGVGGLFQVGGSSAVGGGVGLGGAGGTGGAGGSGGLSGGGAGGSAGGGGMGPNPCVGHPKYTCGVDLATLPKACVDPELATVGTQLPLATCQMSCNAYNVWSCSVSAVDGTSVSLSCSAACATTGP